MEPTHHRMEEAIAAIEHFLDSTGENAHATADDLRQLSRTIAAARAARESHLARVPRPTPHEDRYRQCLERLRLRLREMEAGLLEERALVLQEHECIARTLAWHTSFSRTQE